MPCQDHMIGEDPFYKPDMQKKIDFLTENLCAVLTILESEYTNREFINTLEVIDEESQYTGSILNWWKEHKRIDEYRLDTEIDEFLNAHSGKEIRYIIDTIKRR